MTSSLSSPEANRLLYAEIADRYDEELLEHKHDLRRSLDKGLSYAARTTAVLDACGGSGNVALELLPRGIRPVLVDVSPEMIDIYLRRARAIVPEEPETRVSTVEEFLRTDERSWDAIVFSAALHHLEDYVAVLSLAYGRLAPGGIILVINDPTRVSTPGKLLRMIDYLVHVALREPGTVMAKIWSRVRKRVLGGSSRADSNYGRLAELHAIDGVDDEALRGAVTRLGGDVAYHKLEYGARFRITERICRLMGQPTSFSLVVRRPGR